MAKIKATERLYAQLKAIGVIRIGLVTILAVAGVWYSFALAVSGVTRNKNPQVALMLTPSDSTALAARADQLFFANPQTPPAQVRTLALAALREQALNPKAQRLLGYYADIKGQNTKAERYVRTAAKLSRRELGAQLWLIEDEARNGSSQQTLVHYDIALRTKPEAQTILFPRLLNAIDDREIRTALKPYIRGNNQWAYSFLMFANAQSKNLPAVVDLIVETGGLPNRKAAQDQQLVLLERLVREKYFADARRLFLQMSESKQNRLMSTAFDQTDRDNRFGPIGWQFVNDPDAGAGLFGQAGDSKLALSIYVNSETTRPVAKKLLYLSPGSYRLSVKLAMLDRGDSGFVRWQMRCASQDNNPPLWTLDSISKDISAAFAIPASCPAQFLELIASGGKGQNGLQATIDNVALLPNAN